MKKYYRKEIGANANFAVKFPEQKVATPPQITTLKGSNALIFGHSQTLRYGEKLRSKVLAAGGKATIVAHSSNADAAAGRYPGLSSHIKKCKRNIHSRLFIFRRQYRDTRA